MPLPIAAAVAGLAAGAIAQAIAGAMAAGDYARAAALKQQALEQYGPEILPKLEFEAQRRTETDVPEDPALRGYQTGALADLQREIDYNGATPEEIAQFDRAQQDSGRQMRGYQGAIEQQMAQRGLGNSPLAGLLSQQAAQQATQRGAEQGTQFAADAAQRKISARQALLAGAGGVRNQDWTRAHAIGSAQDAINQYNIGHRQDVEQAKFNAQMALNNARSGILTGQAQDATNQGRETQQVGRDIAGSFNAVTGAFEEGKKKP